MEFRFVTVSEKWFTSGFKSCHLYFSFWTYFLKRQDRWCLPESTFCWLHPMVSFHMLCSSRYSCTVTGFTLEIWWNLGVSSDSMSSPIRRHVISERPSFWNVQAVANRWLGLLIHCQLWTGDLLILSCSSRVLKVVVRVPDT